MENLKKLMLGYKEGRELGNFSKTNASEAIRKEFIEILGTDKLDYKAMRSPEAYKVFQIIAEALDVLVTEGILGNPFFQQFVEYRDVNLGDSNEFDVEDKSMLTISEIADGTLDLRRQKLNTGDSFTVKTSVYGAKVYADFLRYISGRIDFEALIVKIDEAMRVKMAESIYTTFLASGQYLPPEFKHTGNFDATKMNDIIQHIQAVNNSTNVVIAGTRNALRKITDSYSGANSFLLSENMRNQIGNTGLLQTWQGVPLLEIPQVHVPNTFNFMLDDSKLMILPANVKPIKVVKEGESIIHQNEQFSNTDMSLEYTFITRYGIATIFNVLYGMYQLA